MTRLQLAEVASGIGALVFGVGLGTFFATWVAPAAGVVTLAGAFAHGFGMWDKHRLEDDNPASRSSVVVGLYWVCWLMLVSVLVFLMV